MPMTPFLNLFGRSPIGPLEEHMGKVHVCVEVLGPFFKAVFEEQWDEVEKLQKKIGQLEHEADDIKRDLRLHLPNSLFTSVSRGDLLSLLRVQDELANVTKDIAGVVLGRKMVFPSVLIDPFTEFLHRCIDASNQANTAIHELDELLETGFSGSEIKLVEAMIAKLSQIERDTDNQQRQLRRILFDLEDKLPPIHVMFLYKVIEWTGTLADLAREVGDRLNIVLAR